MMQQHRKMMQGQQMQRDPSMDMGGQGPQTPGNMDNAPSPSKRPRLEFEGMAGRPPMTQMAQMAANGQLMQNGMSAQQMAAFAQGPNGQIKMEVC
jgi:hypothetical protein